MVLSAEETKEIEILKHAQKKEIMELANKYSQEEHVRKIERLNILVKINETGGMPKEEI